MKPVRILGRSLASAYRSVVRNFSLSLASISCIIITLIIVSFAILLSYNVNNFTRDIESDLTIVMFATKSATDEQIQEVRKNIDAVPNIKEIFYKYKD